MTRLVGLLLLAASFALAAEQVPFVAAFTSSVPDTTTVPDWCVPLGLAPVATVGAGHATHLGLFSSREGICLDPGIGQFSHGKFTLVGANGDTIIGLSSGQIGSIDGHPAIVGSFSIIGGTGRFANASGIGTATGTINPDGSVSDFVMTGKITRPNH